MAGEKHEHGATIEQLRHDIDSGRTRDKVAAHDPAAVPLGTDDEAAGTAIEGETGPASGTARCGGTRCPTFRPSPASPGGAALRPLIALGLLALLVLAAFWRARVMGEDVGR